MPIERSSSSTIWRTPAPSCITIRLSPRSSSSETVRPANAWPGGQARITSSSKNGSKRDRAVAARGADDPELELARGDALDDGLRVGDRQRDLDAGMLALELAEEQRHDDRGRAGRGADLQLARELALALAGDLVEDLLLEREQPLRAAVEPQPRLGRLDAAAGAVEQLRAEPLLERPHLQRDGGLGDAETLGRLREAAPLDDGAERRELARIHKQIL